MKNPALLYRPEIDGLRALAVISVIIYHLFPHYLPGGFLGVDIFFVISGYLITKIITVEMSQGNFSFQRFYQRRIKRIFPVFILVMALASLFGSLFFIRSEGELQRKGIELGILSFANFFLANRQGYWDLAANENPILHIWSLSVEEQYYLIFPLLLFWLYRRQRSEKAFLNLTLVLFVLFSLTYLLPESWYQAIGLNNRYYLSNLRFPELMIGSLLALVPPFSFVQKRAQAVAFVSFFAIVVCLFAFRHTMPLLLNGALLIPCALTALLIMAMGSNNPITHLFSLKPMVFIGKLSYSLYLFHWLFIAWAHYLTGAKSLSVTNAIVVLLLTAVCSLLSYFLLETPIRRSNLSFKQTLLWIWFIPALSVVSYNLLTKAWVVERNDMYKDVPLADAPKPTAKPQIAVWGDSHAGHLSAFLDYVGSREGWNYASEPQIHIRCHLPISADNQVLDECRADVEQAQKYPIIFISMFYDLKRNNGDLPRITPREFFIPQFDERFRNMVAYFAQKQKVYVFADIKVADRSPLRATFLQKYGLDKFLAPLGELGNKAESNRHIQRLIEGIPNVQWVDPTQYLPEGYFLDGMPLYSDQDHLTNFGSHQMGVRFHQHQRLLSATEVENIAK